MGAGDGPDRAPPPGPCARPRHPPRRGTRASLPRAATQRRRHPPDRRSERPPARARDGERRTDGDAHRRGLSRSRRHRRAVARRAHGAARAGAPGCFRARQLSLRDLSVRAGSGIPAAPRVGRQGRHHAGIHRERCQRRHRAARPRRFGHIRQLFRRQARGTAARDLDGRARHVHVQPALGLERAAAEVARLRRGAGNRLERRQGVAPALHPAAEAVRDSALGARDTAARTRRHR